ncbi:MAG: hypothetical protein C0518_05055 [Opitutus sp.]|nr:hypothetical protein [Opitutus sp.]
MKTYYVVSRNSAQGQAQAACTLLVPFFLFVYLPLVAIAGLFEAVQLHCEHYASAGWRIYEPFPWLCAKLGLHHLPEWAPFARMERGWNLLVLTVLAPLVAAIAALFLYSFVLRFGLGVAALFAHLRLTPWPNLDLVLWPVLAAFLQNRWVDQFLIRLERRGRWRLAARIRHGSVNAAVVAGAALFLPFGAPLLFYAVLAAAHRLVLWLFA